MELIREDFREIREDLKEIRENLKEQKEDLQVINTNIDNIKINIQELIHINNDMNENLKKQEIIFKGIQGQEFS